MRDPNRIPIILSEFEKLWKSSPDLRFGQLFYVLNAQYNQNNDFFNLEDDKFLKIVKEEINKRNNNK